MMSRLSKLPDVVSLSERVIRILGCNPGPFTLQGTNTYLVGKGNRRILIDTGEGNRPEFIQILKDVLLKQQVKLSSIVLTHWHPDHIGGVEEVLNLTEPGECKVYKYPSETHDSLLSKIPLSYLEENQEIRPSNEDDDDTVLRVFYTPGHTTDHVSLVLVQENAIFSGDCILGEGTAVFEDLTEYLKSLEKMREMNASRIYPGHGTEVLNPSERIDYYIKHRLSREKTILSSLDQAGSTGLTVREIVGRDYKETNKELLKAAEWTVSRHLDKLVKENVGEMIHNPTVIDKL